MARAEADVSGHRITAEKLFELFTEVRDLLRVSKCDSYTIPQFCKAHGISVQLYYTLTKEERPAEMRARTRVLISKEYSHRPTTSLLMMACSVRSWTSQAGLMRSDN
jgi:hypothetical protein